MTDTTVGVSDNADNKSTEQLIEEQGQIGRDEDVTDIVANAKIARQMEAAGVDMSNPMEVNLAREKIEKGEDPDPNAGKLDPDNEEGGDPDLEAHEELDKQKQEDESDPEMVMVKIDGVERKVSKAEVDAEGGVIAYQKARSADERLRKAAEQRKQNEEKERLLAQKELDLATKEQALLNKENNNDQLSNKDTGQPSKEALALKDKMYSGDENQTAEAIDTILERTNNSSTPVDTETVIAQATAQAEWNLETKQAVKEFSKEYSDIDSVPEYREYADQATNRIKAENPNWTPRQIIMEAGEQARIKFRDQLREKEATAEDEKRLSNKKATDNTSSASAKPAKKAAPRAKTQSEIVQDMMKNRSHSAA